MEEKKSLGNMVDMVLGLVVLGKEKMNPVFDDLIKKGEVEKKEIKKFIKNIEEKGKEVKEEMGKKIHEEINKYFSKVDFVKREDFIRLEKELLELKKSIKK